AHLPDGLLEDRRRKGLDGRDEMWEGVLHMVPPAREAHQWVASGTFGAFRPLAIQRGLRPYFETGVFRTEDDYRVSDLVFARSDQMSGRGVEGGPPLVVELLSPGDETHAKLDWYAGIGVDEVLVIDPETRRPELFVRRGDQMVLVGAEPVRVETLGVELTVVDGPRLRIVWDDGAAEV
ncbi:MAG: Uma2 family endonuclease, partial [Acidimicrobiia bacterium]